ncbi:ionotropic receptor 21a-like [Athalia rosae]|uniref:ionotropic receptor 21a-like n=1 Tax=Athalia rosae TaxID=37344 RepID=UPI00203404DB|nr:ionotropic receptor 21a-like [Athalia rosae]
MYKPIWVENCTVVITESLVWRRGTKFNANYQWDIGGYDDLYGCPVVIGTLKLPPTMVIEENEEGLPVIVGGTEGNLLLIIAEKLNFSIILTFPPDDDELKNYSQKAEIVNQVASRDIDIGIVRLGLNNKIQNTYSPSYVYDTECLTWGVPITYEGFLNILWVEFDWKVWILIASVLVITAVITFFSHHKISSSIKDNRKKVEFTVLLLDLISLNLGGNVIYLPTSKGGRWLLLIGLFYALIITTAYRSSLGSILTAVKTFPTVNDMEGIVKSNLSARGSWYNFKILQAQAEENDLALKLVEKYVIYNNASEAISKLHSEHNFAYLSRSSNLYYEKRRILKAGYTVNFNILQECVLNYQVVMILRKDHYLLRPINRAILYLQQSGIMDYWRTEFNKEKIDREDADRISKIKILTQRFYSLFYVYCYALILCSLVFLAELFSLKFRPKNRRQRAVLVRCNQ